MPKSLVLGNGNLLVGLNKYAEVSDFYFPYVGLEDQVGAHSVHKIGVWVDNKFSWVDDGSWEISIDYQYETMVSRIEAYNHSLDIKLDFRDAVYNETDIFLREVTVYNLGDKKRVIKIFFHQSFEISESLRGDTAYFDPVKNVIIHYKGRRVFLVNAASDLESFDEYSIGNFNIEGKLGTFKDAEDGKLDGNPIEHGQVDSVISFTLDLQMESSQKIYYWITAARLIKEANKLNDYILEKSPEHLLKTTGDFWRAWVNKLDFCFCDLDKNIVELFKKSQFIVRTHADNKGAIIASCDSDMLQHGKDNYSYMWPRDGALVVIALDQSGDNSVARRFFEFCNDVISDEGYFMHKYRTDRSLGSSWHPWVKDGNLELPIQEDETALVLIALRQHFEVVKDLEFIESIYNSLIKKAADFMVSYRDEKTHLPKSSYDLWEEKFGIHTFTAAAVYKALISASEFAELLGKTDASEEYKKAAEEVKEAIFTNLYDEKGGYFYKKIDQNMEVDKTIDCSSAYGVFQFGILEKNDPRLKKVFQVTEDKLRIKTPIDGLARYENDYYYRVSTEVTGNPWFITTLWLCQYQIVSSSNKEELIQAAKWLLWVLKNSLTSGILSEQLDPFTGAQLSAAPLTWSHAEFLVTVLQYLEKSKEFGGCDICSEKK